MVESEQPTLEKGDLDRLVVLKVGPEDVTLFEFEQDFRSSFKGSRGLEDPKKAVEKTIDYVRNSRVFYQESLARGYGRDKQIEARIQVASWLWIGGEFFETGSPGSEISANDVEIAAIEPGSYERLYLSMITVDSLQEAAGILDDLHGGMDFADMARDNSRDPAWANGGTLKNPILRGFKSMLPLEIVEFVFDWSGGEYTDPVKTPFGWSVFRIDRKESLSEEEIATYRESLKKRIIREKKAAFADALIKAYPPVVVEDAVDIVIAGNEQYSHDLVLATVNEMPVTVERVKEYLNFGNRKMPQAKDDLINAIEAISRYLAAYVAAEYAGITDTPRSVDAIKFYRRSLVSDAFSAELFKEITVPTDQDLWQYFGKILSDRNRFAEYGWFHLSELRTGTEENVRDAKKKFDEGAPWNMIFNEYNEDSSLINEGSLGIVYLNELDWILYSALEDLLPPRTTEPIHRDRYWSLILMNDRVDAPDIMSFESVKGNLYNTLLSERLTSEKGSIITGAVEKYPFEVFHRTELERLAGLWLKEIAEKRGVQSDDPHGNQQSPHGSNPHGGGIPQGNSPH